MHRSRPDIHTRPAPAACALSMTCALALLIVLLGPAAAASPVPDSPRAPAATRHAAKTGLDSANLCLNPNQPCLTVQHAIDVAQPGDTILIAEGTYVENLVIPGQLSLLGGYEAAGWTRDLNLHPTFIDGSASQPVPGDWDGRAVAKVAVVRDDNIFRMWYDGTNLLGEVQVGLASSANGTTWTKSAANPVLGGTPGAWDQFATSRSPWIIKEGGVFKMWYVGGEPRQLGYATSPNGITWTKHPGNPILQPGPDGYDQGAVAHATVLHEGIYKLWYHAIGDEGPIIAYATSPDGVNWTKQGPVLHPEGGNWDDYGVSGPSVLRYNGLYWMWYAGVGSQPAAIGVATSFDGVTWTRVGTAPVISEGNPIGDPHVLLHGSIFKMWYQDFAEGVIKYAESSDGVNWTPFAGNPVLTPGALGQWGEPVIRFEDGSDGSVLDGLGISGGQGAQAGGVDAFHASVTIKNCWIHDNYAGIGDSTEGGGILGASQGKTLTIADSTLVRNGSRSGASAVRAHMGTLTMVNVLVIRNHSMEAPALHLNGVANLTNVTVADNDGGVLHNPPEERLLTVNNSIVYGNGWAINEGPEALVQARYSDIEGGWLGSGNIDANPMFRDPDVFDYHLSRGSACVDAGSNALAPDHDLDGDARPLDGDGDGLATADMGVDELLLRYNWLPKLLHQ